MKNLELINENDAEYSKNKLNVFYKENLIPAEKKEYLTKLKDSQGPYMGIEGKDGKTKYLLDAASQIATLGLGFNPSGFFGCANFLEAWTNNEDGEVFQQVRESYKTFLKNKLGWDKLDVTFTHSGAESNEVALGECYKRRVNKNANKVLAFEGSFHGRMMVSLSSTWNKSKREPFQLPGFETVYCPFPELKDDEIIKPVSQDWREKWDDAPSKSFDIPNEWNTDSELKLEVDCLLKIREELESKKIFAIIIEPMQCEGGDRYGSNRFFTGLLLLARSFKVPVVFDEVQTGFHLGREFFWHKQFQLKDIDGKALTPSYLVCAKKSQSGLVISHTSARKEQEYQVASVLRGYAHALILDQSLKRIIHIENYCRKKLDKLIANYSKFIQRPRLRGISFAFDLLNKDLIPTFIQKRFKYGLLYYPAGAQTLRFRLNTAFTEQDIDFLFSALDSICSEIFQKEERTAPSEFQRESKNTFERLYRWQELIIETKLSKLHDKTDSNLLENKVKELFLELDQGELVEVTSENFSQYKKDIERLELRNYEKVRQTPISSFEKCINDGNGIGLGLKKNNQLHAIAFAGQITKFPYERGLRKDYNFCNPKTLYMIDLTIDKDYQGNNLGRELKYAMTTLAIARDYENLNSRNRDKLAASMLNINIGLGAFVQDYLYEDYLDEAKYRDSFYNRCPLKWKEDEINLSSSIKAPLGQRSLTAETIAEKLPVLVNKICLSNFVSEKFLTHIKELAFLAPKNLQHVYSSSGQSECVDKIGKSIWYNKKEKYKQLTFFGHHFGYGSFFSRSLTEADPFFPVKKLDHPTDENYKDILREVENELKTNSYMSVWLEPIRQKYMDFVPYDFLKKLRGLCDKYDTKLVYNETASYGMRYHSDQFLASNDNEMTPDAAMLYMGGQAAMVMMSEDIFVEKPLMMISTWDGDEFSLGMFHKAINQQLENLNEFKNVRENFSNKLKDILSKYDVDEIELKNGVGHFVGNIPKSLSKMFKFINNRYIVSPSYDNMKQFLEQFN